MVGARKALEDVIEALIAVLDLVDPDPDNEDSDPPEDCDPAEDSDPDHGIDDVPHDREEGI